MRSSAMALGIPAITGTLVLFCCQYSSRPVEIGDPSRFQKRFVRNALLGVTQILSHLKMIPGEPDQAEFEPVVCSSSSWIFTSGGGILTVLPDVNTWVKRGEVIATRHDIFGGLQKTYYAPQDGIVVGKSCNPICTSGSRILHLGVINDAFATNADDGHL
jgi:predicted deacylase